MEVNKYQNRNKFRVISLISCLTFTFWIVGQKIDIYKYKALGAIFEMLWFPILISIFTIPFFTFYFWSQEKYKIKSKFMSLFIWSLISLLIIYLLT
jgi:hypothetical protein